jgi:glucose-6-phosphate-specific signal transduction histidine kinase
METPSHGNHYGRLLIMTVLSFISMYVLMYAMVDRVANALPNLNQGYMAALMTAPMVIIEVLLMSAMYHNKRWNADILALAAVTGIALFAFIRQQTAIGDGQFLRSMIPHHAGAILMCGQAPVQDPEIVALCRTIIASQQTEIDQMKAILAR